jgi:hypothetical protein
LVAHGTDAETLTPQDCSENLREGWGLLAKPLDELDTGNEDQEVGVNPKQTSAEFELCSLRILEVLLSLPQQNVPSDRRASAAS